MERVSYTLELTFPQAKSTQVYIRQEMNVLSDTVWSNGITKAVWNLFKHACLYYVL